MVVGILTLVGCGVAKPPFSLRSENGVITVHVETLGEYPTSISRIVVSEAETGHIVWKVIPSGELFQIHSFPLRAGLNSATLKPFWGAARTVVPQGRQSFLLKTGVLYQVRVCSGEGFKRCAGGTVRLESRGSAGSLLNSGLLSGRHWLVPAALSDFGSWGRSPDLLAFPSSAGRCSIPPAA